jgi:hypothetical protein
MSKWLYDTEEDELDAEETVSPIGQSGGEDNQEVEPRIQA